MPIRALHLIKASQGIAASWAQRQIRELVRMGIEVHVAITPGGPMVRRYEEAGAKVHEIDLAVNLLRPVGFLRKVNGLREIVELVRPNLVHSHFVDCTILMRLALRSKPEIRRIFQVPGVLHLEHELTKRLELKLAQDNDYWVGSCRKICQIYRDAGVPEDRVWLSYYCPDNIVKREAGRLRTELGIPDSTFVAGMIAYMYPPKRWLGHTRGIKGHEDFLGAIKECAARGRDIKGVLIGGAYRGGHNYEKKLIKYGKINCGDRVVFLGTRNDVMDLYPDLDVAIHPSLSESLGGSGESLLMEIPTIATNIGGFVDVIEHEKTGWLVAPGRPDQIAETIDTIIENREQARRIARQGRQRAMEMFDLQRNTKIIHDIYGQLVEA